jgi:hypothetical protein
MEKSTKLISFSCCLKNNKTVDRLFWSEVGGACSPFHGVVKTKTETVTFTNMVISIQNYFVIYGEPN